MFNFSVKACTDVRPVERHKPFHAATSAGLRVQPLECGCLARKSLRPTVPCRRGCRRAWQESSVDLPGAVIPNGFWEVDAHEYSGNPCGSRRPGGPASHRFCECVRGALERRITVPASVSGPVSPLLADGRRPDGGQPGPCTMLLGDSSDCLLHHGAVGHVRVRPVASGDSILSNHHPLNGCYAKAVGGTSSPGGISSQIRRPYDPEDLQNRKKASFRHNPEPKPYRQEAIIGHGSCAGGPARCYPIGFMLARTRSALLSSPALILLQVSLLQKYQDPLEGRS